ncbi:MAG: prepilin-type N-terminal cleavage/methylation domain-containing protein [Candidatus Omnitrophica bacterium]|nr:prepilin-type N-terminal cleavage/methylation domain-containing protein [Candidatus Omnitrophota bacterium]
MTLDKILLKEKNMKNIAFTLMELLVVMAIITILGGDNC